MHVFSCLKGRDGLVPVFADPPSKGLTPANIDLILKCLKG